MNDQPMESPFDVRVDDSGDRDSDTRYTVLQDGEEATGTLRMARRLPCGRCFVDVDSTVESIVDDCDQFLADGGADVRTFARWDDRLVTARPGAAEALRQWADKYLQVEVWELEEATP